MKEKRLVFCVIVIAALFILGVPAFVGAVDVSIVGEVNDQYQIVGDDGKIYEVADSEAGDVLVTKHIGYRVSVSGSLSKIDDDMEMVLVKKFRVLDEETNYIHDVEDDGKEK